MTDKDQTGQEASQGKMLSRRQMLKSLGMAGAAGAAAPFLGAAPAQALSLGDLAPGPDWGDAGYPSASNPNEIWALNYAGALYPGFRNGPALSAMFFSTTGMHVEDDGSLKVADARTSVIRNVSAKGDVTVFSGSLMQYPFRDGIAQEATFNSLNDIDKLSDGSYVVGDRENHAIRRVLADGSVTTIAGQGNGKNKYNGDKAVATQAQLNRSLTLSVATKGTAWHVVDTVYFTDRDNHIIRKLVPNGDGTFALVTVAGTAPAINSDGSVTVYPGYADGPASSAKFRGACGIVLSADERYLYIGERDNNVVRCIDLKEGMVSTYAGVQITGQAKGDFADGPAYAAKFNGCSQLDYDKKGNLYVCDRFNHVVRRITPDKKDPMHGKDVTTYAGTPGKGGRTGGPAGQALFLQPWGIAVDRKRDVIYVADTGNSRIAVVGSYKAIWPVFMARLNAARAFEFQRLMSDYQSYYQGELNRENDWPGAFVGEGPSASPGVGRKPGTAYTPGT